MADIKTYYKMNETVKDLLRRNDDPMHQYILARLEELEAVSASIVHCSECVRRGDGEEVDDRCWCYEASHIVKPNDFCSRGTREDAPC